MCQDSWSRYAKQLLSSVMGDIRQRNGSLSNNDTELSVVPYRADDIRVLCHKVDDVDVGEEIELQTRSEVPVDTDAEAEDCRRVKGPVLYRVCLPVCCKRNEPDRDEDDDDDGEEDTGANTVKKGKLSLTLNSLTRSEDIILKTYGS